jgi:hypothetical protein
MLGIERQPGAGQAVGNAAMHRAQAADRGEQAQHAAAARLDQAGIGPASAAISPRGTSVTISTCAWLG